MDTYELVYQACVLDRSTLGLGLDKHHGNFKLSLSSNLRRGRARFPVSVPGYPALAGSASQTCWQGQDAEVHRVLRTTAPDEPLHLDRSD
jgi:hypothetical protein